MKKVNPSTWTMLYVITGIIDIAQIIIDFTGIGVGINVYADPIIGIVLIIYLNHIGVKMFQYPSRLFSMLGVGILESFTGGIAPAWIVDIYYIHRSYKKELAEYEKKEKISQLTSNARQTAYSDGKRGPTNSNEQSGPLYSDGYRRPRP